MNTIRDIGIASQIGQYADAVETSCAGSILFLSGTPGLTDTGHLSDSFAGQAEQAWRNVTNLLASAGLGPQHLIKVSQYLIRKEDIPVYAPIRARWLGTNRPASMLSIVPGLVRPDFLIEIEAIAVKPVAE
jgi:enamine deaminase RidA (YjgF/YER057c/UK114 family)